METIYKGIDYADVYDYEFYRENNEYVKQLCGDDKRATLIHFVNEGMKEGEVASETFDVRFYRKANKELEEQYGDDWEKYYLHYMNVGKEEGRKGVEDELQELTEETVVSEKIDFPEDNENISRNSDILEEDSSYEKDSSSVK